MGLLSLFLSWCYRFVRLNQLRDPHRKIWQRLDRSHMADLNFHSISLLDFMTVRRIHDLLLTIVSTAVAPLWNRIPLIRNLGGIWGVRQEQNNKTSVSGNSTSLMTWTQSKADVYSITLANVNTHVNLVNTLLWISYLWRTAQIYLQSVVVIFL